MSKAEEVLTKGIIETTFLFGAIEFCIKCELGFRPMEVDFINAQKKFYFRSYYHEGEKAPVHLSLVKGWDILTKQASEIS